MLKCLHLKFITKTKSLQIRYVDVIFMIKTTNLVLYAVTLTIRIAVRIIHMVRRTHSIDLSAPPPRSPPTQKSNEVTIRPAAV